MKRDCRTAIVVLYAAICFVTAIIPAGAQTVGHGTFNCMDSTGGVYRVNKRLISYRRDSPSPTCYNGMPWCCRTNNNSVRLSHFHYTEDFTAAERSDADRWFEVTYDYGIVGKFASATTRYNCHQYALDSTGGLNVWNVSPELSYGNDFRQVDGDCEDPFEIGQVCRDIDRIQDRDDHSSFVLELFHRVNPHPDINDAVKLEVAKCGGYGEYSYPPGCICYWPIDSIYERR